MTRRALAVALAGLAGLTLAVSTPLVAAAQPNQQNLANAGTSQVCAGRAAVLGCQLEVATSGGGAHAMLRSDTPMGWGATDIRRSNGVPAHSPHSGTVAVIDVGAYPTLSSDLAVYRTQYGLSACTTGNGCLRQIDYHGGPAYPEPTSDSDKYFAELNAEETSADLDMVSAVCPDCSLLEVQLPTSVLPASVTASFDPYADAIATATQTAIAEGAQAVSISYALPSDAHMTTGLTAAALNHRGVAITAATGDHYFTADHATWPQDLPTVTAVGGTTMIGQGGQYVSGAWDQAGSGCAPGVAPAVGQPASISVHCNGSRTGSDVSTVAADIAVYDSYTPLSHSQQGWLVGSGTSASSPQIAAMYVAGGHLSRVLGPNTLYGAPRSAFIDVTSGTNGKAGGADGSCMYVPDDGVSIAPVDDTPFDNQLCQAQPGWDGPTGLGTPRGLAAF